MNGKHSAGLRLSLLCLLALSLTICTQVGRTQIAPPLTTLHSFSGASDGGEPSAGLIQASDGNFYGTTGWGGANGTGTVFKITTSGTLTTLYSFSTVNSSPPYNNSDGSAPFAGLIQGKDGNLYGTTEGGGANDTGTVFKITTSGALTTLYTFNAFSSSGYLSNSNGAGPNGLIQGKDGNLYGTTWTGGVNGTGTVFKITTTGTLTTIYTFSALSQITYGTNSDGAHPEASLIQGKDGNLYGTASEGGANGAGTVFKLAMVPVITSFSPTTGPVGTSITVTGVNFTEATAVNFGAISVPFTINSDTSLTFTVPSPGAKSAKITVVNPFGKGASSQSFTMTPTITSFSPTTGPIGTSVTLTGVNFTEATSITFGALAVPNFTIQSDTSLRFTVPTGAKTAKITVVNPFGKGTSAKAFKVTP